MGRLGKPSEQKPAAQEALAEPLRMMSQTHGET
jgi:hypothetical protein